MTTAKQVSNAIYFLGAGASAAVSSKVVITINLLEEALNSSHGGRPEDLAIGRRFIEFLARDSMPRIDDVLSLIDQSIYDQLPLSREWNISELTQVRISLYKLTYNCIQSTIHKEERPDSPLITLIERCRKEAHRTIITLNWDCLVERALIQVLGRAEGAVDYGVPCVTLRGDDFPVDADAVLVLKPHGSLSWGHCQFCGTLMADLSQPFDFAGSRHCPKCDNPALRFVLTPPVRNSRQWPWFLSALWNRAERAICESDCIVFVGYSLPPEDVHVRVSLLRALARRKTRTNTPLHIEVVTQRDPQKVLQHRYMSMLGGMVPSSGLSFYEAGFSQWVREKLC